MNNWSKKKIMLSILAFVVVFVGAWYAYQITNAKPVDPNLGDPCSAASIEKRGGKPSPFCN